MKRMFSCSSSQVAVESWNKQDQKLLEAVEKGDVGRVAALAARKTSRPAKLNAVGQSAFHLAASKGLTECLTLLLAHGAPVNEKNDDGSTALHLATIACQPQCVKVLLQYGANEGHVDGQSRTPLHWAATSGCASSVLLLCDHEAVLDVTDAHGQTPLMLAARGNHAAICAQLLQRGADPNLADKEQNTALALACEHGSLESAELLLSHGAALGDTGDEERWHHLEQKIPSRALRRLLRRARCSGRENGAGCTGDSVPQTEGTPGSDSEEEEDEGKDEKQQDGSDVQRLQEQLERKTRECQRLEAASNSIRQQVRELAQLLAGAGNGMLDEDEDGACLALLAQHMEELRKRMMAEGEGHQPGGTCPGAGAAALVPFLSWLRDECARLREAKVGAFTRSKGLQKEVEDALRSKLHYEVVSAEAVRRSLAAWEKLVLVLEQALSRADETHTKILEESRDLLETLERELPQALNGTAAPSQRPEPAPGGKSREEPPGEGGSAEKEMQELKESNGMLLAELARLGRERERLQEELRGLREQDPELEGAAQGEVRRLRRELARQRRELALLRDGVGERVREAAGDAGAGILRELHHKLDGLVRSQQEALQLITEMEGEGTPAAGAPGSDGDAVPAVLADLEEAVAELVLAAGPCVPRALQRLVSTAAALRDRSIPPGPPGAAGDAERWREVAAEEARAKEEALGRAAERERELRELRERADGLERSLGSLRDRAGELARACRDKDGKMKKLLVETEKLSAEVLGLRSQSARLQLQLEVQQKNHRDIVAIYRTHLLNAAQGFMDEGVHAMLLRILRTQG
ncbi:ankyrin repeat domain-containing protein 35 isoform X1 [Pezoporus flaviventris]|uniref:ankyrin repeat domain-containing protein 35 isoform X1 n=1 Tax=Pezoporus flaviventris TaxID=889875 RepID=UPI002AB01D9D|nr:ankyrin repeat domain-containing protein 35 isoform X1 [Pezoporus flaviventris]